jgi:hypothetical protein
VDTVEAQAKAQATRTSALEQRVRELAQEVAETLHVGNYEAMYRLEREENIRLRTTLRLQPETTLVEGWIAQLETLVVQLRGTAPVDLPLTQEEQRIVQRFGIELGKGLERA